MRTAHVARQGLLAGKSFQRLPTALRAYDDCFHVFNPRVVGAAEPDGLNRRIGSHFLDRSVSACCAQIEGSGQRSCIVRVLTIGAEDAANVCVAHGDKRLKMKAGDESGADDPDAELRFTHEFLECSRRICGCAKLR
jgi:hypothetical protein